MLNKLLKYDLKWIYKGVVVFYILAAIFSIIGRIFAEIENSLLFDILSKISFGVAISMIINSLINCLMRSWAKFIQNVYKDESYLTHTLPVSKNAIYSSKILSAIICIFSTTIVGIACLFICYYSKENIDVLKKMLELAASTYDTTVIKLLLLIFVVVFIEIIYIVFIGYVGIILGHKTNRNKILLSIVFSIAIYMFMQFLTLGFIVVYGLINPDIMNLINTTSTIDIDSMKLALYFANVIYIAYIVTLYFIGKKELNKGVNID